MTVDEAEKVVMPFGKYKGRKLGDIADKDVLYIDWLAGETIYGSSLREAIGLIQQDRANEINQKLEDRE